MINKIFECKMMEYTYLLKKPNIFLADCWQSNSRIVDYIAKVKVNFIETLVRKRFIIIF